MRKALARLPPSIIALLLQFSALILVALGMRMAGLQATPLILALLCGAIATAFSYFAGLERWWLLIQLLFAPALVLMLAFNIPSGFFLAAFLVMLVVYWSTFRSQVPLYLSSKKVWQALELLLPSPSGVTSDLTALPSSRMASGSIRGTEGEGTLKRQGANHPGRSLTPTLMEPLAIRLSPQADKSLVISQGERGEGFSFMDIGSGMGGVLLHLAAARPDGRYFGVETAPLPWLASWLRLRLGGYRNCKVQWGSMWDCDLAHYDMVFAYLSPVPMEQLWHKVRREMRPGTLFISNTFAVPEHPPQDTITLDDLHHSTLYIWRN